MTREEEYYRYCTQVQYDTYQHEGQPCIEDAIKWADAHPINPWYKVSEELPEPLTYVIVRFSNNTMAVSQRTNHFIGETTTVKVTHWMPIPEPPKVE